MTDQQKVNLNPGSFGEGGGLMDDFDGIISDIRFIMTDYDGNMQEQVPVAKVVYDVDGEEYTDLLSVGGKGDFAPDETGMGLIVLKSKSALTKASKFGMFLGSLVEAGFPLNKMDGGDISYLNGLSGHFLRKAIEFKGIVKKEGKETTVLLCTKINGLPGEAKGKGKGKGKAKAATIDGAIVEAIAEVIQGALIEADGELAKKTLLTGLFKNEALAALDKETPGAKKAGLKLASDDTFLGGRDEWSYEDGILKV